jgi:oligoribonuclease NrnB/cAMP/cGMP phosphodiesterase (DHH superfamily)
MFNRIITHNDFDGIVSAALCSAIHEIEEIEFTGPNHVQNRGYSVLSTDIVCDLPYPGECGLWFDHHEGNLDEIKRLGKEPSALPGSVQLMPSCARVIFEYYKDDYEFSQFYSETVAETDRIDSFAFKDVAEWRAETPARIVNDSLKNRFLSHSEEEEYLKSLVFRIAEQPLAEIAVCEDVRNNYQNYCRDELKMVEIIKAASFFHPLDKNREIAFIDLTGYSKRVSLVRNLAQIIYPEIYGVFLVQNIFDRGIKTTSFTISGSMTIKKGINEKDIGDIMRILNIGDGHKGAGSGQVHCSNKSEMEIKKKETIERVIEIWQSQQ